MVLTIFFTFSLISGNDISFVKNLFHLFSKICSKFQEFQFIYWTDESSPTVEGLKKNQITELQLSKEIEPGDPETSQIMNKKKQEFLDRNK